MSLVMRAATAALRLRPKPLASAAEIKAALARQHLVDAEVLPRLHRTHAVVRSEAHGVPVVTVTPRGEDPVGEVLYLHGGAYVHPLVKPHWSIIAALTKGVGVRVTVPLYGLAPQHTAAESLPGVFRVYDDVTASGRPVVLAGDSAGGGLAMACALRARDEQRATAGAVVLFSPWVDATTSNPAIAAIEPRDPMLAAAGLVWAAQRWAGEWPLTDPRISPINDDLDALPRLRVFQGGQDIFLPDVRAFVDKARRAGTDAVLHTYPDAFHVFVGAARLPESRQALDLARGVVAAVVADPTGPTA